MLTVMPPLRLQRHQALGPTATAAVAAPAAADALNFDYDAFWSGVAAASASHRHSKCFQKKLIREKEKKEDATHDQSGVMKIVMQQVKNYTHLTHGRKQISRRKRRGRKSKREKDETKREK